MSDRGRDVRRLLTQLGLGGDTRQGPKAPPQLGTPREAGADSLAAFFDSVRRAPPPQTVAEAPPTLEREPRTGPAVAPPPVPVASQPAPIPVSPIPPPLPAPEVPGVRALPESVLSPPTRRIELQVQVPVSRAAASPVTPPPVGEAAPITASAAPLADVFRRLVEAGERRR